MMRKHPFPYALPFVGGIIEREKNGEVEILMQTRWKPDRDKKYSGTFEFPAGVLDKLYESVFEALKREIKEETNLDLLEIIDESKTKVYSPQKDDASFGFRPFCCVQQLKEGKPWIGFIFRCRVKKGVKLAQKNEVKDIRWMSREEVKRLFLETPEKLFALEIAAWEYYFKEL